jgi:hypothetical protein
MAHSSDTMHDIALDFRTKIGDPNWTAAYKERKRWLWGEAKYCAHAQLGCETAVFAMKPPLETHPRQATVERCKLSRHLMTKAMTPPGQLSCAGKKVPAFHVALLASAIEVRDASAAHSLWWMLKQYDGPVPSLGMENATITVDMLHFLLVRVQAPDLACTIIEQFAGGVDKAWDHFIYRSETESADLTAFVAAVMDAVLLVSRRHEQPTPEGETAFELDVRYHFLTRKNVWDTCGPPQEDRDDALANTWWHCVLDHLYAALAKKVGRIYRFRQEVSLRCMSFTLLERAVICSEVSSHPVRRILEQCRFSCGELRRAIYLAVYPGNVRASKRVEIVGLIYERLWAQVVAQHPKPAGDAPDRHEELSVQFHRVKELKGAWTAVLLNARGYSECVLGSTDAAEAQTLRIPTVTMHHHRMEANVDASLQQLCPEDDLAIVDALMDFHDAMPRSKGMPTEFDRLLSGGVIVLLTEPTKTHLLEKFFAKKQERRMYPYFLVYTERFFSDLFNNHNGEVLWPVLSEYISRLIKMDGKVGKRIHDEAIKAFRPLVVAGNRVGVRLLLKVLGNELPEELRTTNELYEYIKHMCTVGTEQSARSLGKECTLFMTRMIQADLRQFLECGAFTEAQLNLGLRFAGNNDLHAAVEVLASPPFNATMHEEDPFTHCLLAQLLAPGAPATRETAERFEGAVKRQRTED